MEVDGSNSASAKTSRPLKCHCDLSIQQNLLAKAHTVSFSTPNMVYINVSGTHGHMKCVFDAQLKSQDTVLLNLYKRMFPKWTYENCIVTDRDKNTDEMES